MKVSDILNKKGSHIYSVLPGVSVYDALKLMGEKNIGALLVMEGNKLNGIISERDYARKVVLKGKTSLETLVSDIMTEKVITILPEDNLERCMELMSQNHIRHIPVVKNGEVKGVISISDVVTAIIESQKETITYLQNYIVQ
ncbi:MAG TPA: CBS domain-containing protein [Flavisolibacter sp.]|jgi:CBS domain-containing protein|nr:CBS domain-containing protein [Flavisolibacter sp.]